MAWKASPVGLAVVLTLYSCDLTVDEFDELSDLEFSVPDNELEAVVEQVQIAVLNGRYSKEQIEGLADTLEIANTIVHPAAPLVLSLERRDALQSKLDTYLALAIDSKLTDQDNWLVGECDALLFGSLHRVSGLEINLNLAESKTEEGRWFRRPAMDCFSSGNSKSTISRDMFLGLALALWNDGGEAERATIERLLRYARANDWVIGEAVDQESLKGAATLSGGLAGTLFDLQAHLGGEAITGRFLPQFWDEEATGFRAHLLVLHILLRGAMRGGISAYDLANLTAQLLRQPRNALFLAVFKRFTDGDMNAVAELLLNSSFFPNTSLPSTANYCTPYLWQRDDDTDTDSGDWLPCPETEESHPGIDFSFVAAVVLGKLRVRSTVDPEFQR